MIRFTKDKVELLHRLMAEETGGSIGVRDEALLESALNGIYATYGGEELYKSKEEKGARLGFSLISNHAFVDGNKRIGMHVMLTFLEVNGVKIECSSRELADTGMSVAAGEMGYEELLDWVYTHEV
ncbi:MAG: type II toxin-antitoxin system death-on-curing family toxin [Firmicutes bacterium]|nr:type II toxin-antitoxin system death-on-curing family toxin [Bacillota bacterium]